jgi:hypothetical protein
MNTLRYAATLALLLGGCAGSMYSAYSEPYVIFVSEHRMTMQGVLPAIVTAVDGVNVADGVKAPVKPGTRAVEVSVTGMPEPNRRTITVDAKACTRYYLGAKRPSPPATEWTVSVTGTEAIGECKPG